MPGNLIEVFFLAEETYFGVMKPQLLREIMLNGKVGRCDDVLPDTLVVNLKAAGAVHEFGSGADSIYNFL